MEYATLLVLIDSVQAPLIFEAVLNFIFVLKPLSIHFILYVNFMELNLHKVYLNIFGTEHRARPKTLF